MKLLFTLFALCMSLALVASQRFFGQFPTSVQSQFTYNSLQAPTNIRDPRQNRGPVVFPPSPPDAIEESSGVVVGASGFGFVPPQQSETIYLSPLDAQLAPLTAYQFYSTPYTQRFSFF